MNKLLLQLSKKLLIVLAIGVLSIVIYTKVKGPDIVYEEKNTTEDLKGSVYTTEMAFEQARQVGKIFGYENMWSFTYQLDQSPAFVKKSEDENWLSGSAKSVGQFFLGKEYSIDLQNYFMLGYDFSTLEEENIVYLEESQTVRIHLPELELSYTPDYEETEFGSSIGIFRLDFSEEEKHKMYQDSINMGIESFTKEEIEEIQKGHDLTQEAIRHFLFGIPAFSEHVKEIEFIQDSNNIAISIEEYKKQIQEEKGE